ncbi:hypothetical protein AVEN_56494-1 [Araneus ventricosus]|uniref:Uncharacterized protein n=1 Tax=Araneus ventricosus TaxID=182803 RepID=A0A4Y2S3S1_ARAVE|nr:hypothetical protein AVEN_56494-1 [Araneus ventricosus]
MDREDSEKDGLSSHPTEDESSLLLKSLSRPTENSRQNATSDSLVALSVILSNVVRSTDRMDDSLKGCRSFC